MEEILKVSESVCCWSLDGKCLSRAVLFILQRSSPVSLVSSVPALWLLSLTVPKVAAGPDTITKFNATSITLHNGEGWQARRGVRVLADTYQNRGVWICVMCSDDYTNNRGLKQTSPLQGLPSERKLFLPCSPLCCSTRPSDCYYWGISGYQEQRCYLVHRYKWWHLHYTQTECVGRKHFLHQQLWLGR